MNNNTYNGFYTENIKSIRHDYKNGIPTSFIWTFGKVYEIPNTDIDSILIEDVNVLGGNNGQYRIYEFNYEYGDVKKVYVDNRASLFASRNGDFGANDTILFSSAYNEITWIFYTDGQGRIKKFSDKDKLLFFDYDSKNEFTILDLSTNKSEHYILNSQNNAKSSRAFDYNKQISTFFFELAKNEGFKDFIGGIGLNAANTIVSNFAQAINDVGNNPELHNQVFIIDGLSILGDFVGIGASLLATVTTTGWTIASIGASAGSLLNDCKNLIDHIYPDTYQIQKYKEYYQNKYSIHIAASPAENISYTTATLCGEATSLEGLNGIFSFIIYGETNEAVLSGKQNNITHNSCIVTANASKLKPGCSYFYSVQYTCNVDGLRLKFYADNIEQFKTISPSIYTGEVQSKSKNRAEVVCQFYNAPEGAICGVEYYSSNDKNEKRTSYSHDGEYYFTLSSLKPNTTYTYCAFIIIEGIYVYAEESKQFTVDSQSGCPDENHPHWIDLGLPSGTLWSCCNAGAAKPEEYGTYYNFINTTSAPSREQIEELIRYTSYSFTYQNGIWGSLFRGQNGGEIFLPAAGYYRSAHDDKLYGQTSHHPEGYDRVGTAGFYWSSTKIKKDEDPVLYGYELFFQKDYNWNCTLSSVGCWDAWTGQKYSRWNSLRQVR